MRHINNVMARNGAMFEQDLAILLQTNNLLLARFQLVSELSEGIFDFFLAHGWAVHHSIFATGLASVMSIDFHWAGYGCPTTRSPDFSREHVISLLT